MASSDVDTLEQNQISLSETLPCYSDIVRAPRNVFDRVITITVGTNGSLKEFQVHRGLLCHYSGLFRTLLNGRLRSHNSHSLPEEKSTSFQLFYDWLYSGEVVCDDATPLGARAIIDLYFFADMYMVQELKDRALELYFLRFLKDWQAPQDLTRSIYEKTADVSSLRKLHIDILVETFSFENLCEYMNDDPKEFLVDLLEACRDRQTVPGSCSAIDEFSQWVENKKARFCELYHEHARLQSYPTFEPGVDMTSDEPASEPSEIDARACYSCGETGHFRRDCSGVEAHNNIKCWNCDERGHRFSDCPEPRDTARLKCRNCSQRGHTIRRCPYAVEAEPNEEQGSFGGLGASAEYEQHAVESW